MRLVIFGSRWIDDMRALENALEACGVASQVTEIVSGGARGVDRLGERYARQHGLPCKLFPEGNAKRALFRLIALAAMRQMVRGMGTEMIVADMRMR